MFSPKGSTCLGHVGRLEDRTERQADPQVGEVAERLSHTRQISEDGRDAGEQHGQNFALCVSRRDRRTTFCHLGLTLDISK